MGVSQRKKLLKLANGSCEDTIVSNVLSQHLGGESAILGVAGGTRFQSSTWFIFLM